MERRAWGIRERRAIKTKKIMSFVLRIEPGIFFVRSRTRETILTIIATRRRSGKRKMRIRARTLAKEFIFWILEIIC
jgi:hypothetical protein